MRSSTPSLLVVALLSAGAQAAIVGTGGSAVQIPAPPSAMFGALTGAPAWCWDEQQSVMVSGLPVNLSVNPSNSTAPTPGVVNGLVDSHFIHFNDVMNPQTFGSVTFNAPIIGVAYGNFELDASDLASGALGTIYPTGSPMRGVNSTFPVSVVSISGNTIHFDLRVGSAALADLDQIRVFTAVPTPGSLALLGVAGLAGVRRRRGA